LCFLDGDVYFWCYVELDKGWIDMDEVCWLVFYWDIDMGMVVFMILLMVVDEGLGGCFFGVFFEIYEDIFVVFGILCDWNFVGVVFLGYLVLYVKSGSFKCGLCGLD